MRKANEDVLARTAVERMVGDIIAPNTDGEVDRLAKTVVSVFKAVEFERVVKTVGDEQIALRRPLLTGAWEVDPDSIARQGK